MDKYSGIDNYGKPKSEYISTLPAMTDDELVKAASDKCWLSAFASNNPRSDYHWQVDAIYDEAKARGKMWLYQRGWNQAYALAGHAVSDADIAAANGDA